MTSGSEIHIKLRAIGTDGDPIKFSVNEGMSRQFGTLENFNPNTGDATYKAKENCETSSSCTDFITFNVTDSHNSTSNNGSFLVRVNPSNSLSSGSQIGALSTYTSPKYGIRSILYPSNWTIKENDLSSDYNTGTDYNNVLHIVEFSPPNSPAFVVISISNSQSARNLDNYLSYASSVYRSRSSNYQDIGSNSTTNLAGNPAYSLEFKDVPSRSVGNETIK